MPPFTTQPFDLGNTLLRAGQIQSFQNRNELSKLNLQNERGISNALRNDDIDSLSNFGSKGASLEIELTRLATEGKEKEFQKGLNRARLIHNGASQALNSADSRQSAHLFLRGLKAADTELAERFGDVNFLTMSPEEANDILQRAVGETQFAVDPVTVSKIASKQIREGDDFVTRTTTDGQVDTTPAGVIARSSIDRPKQTSPSERELRIDDFMKTLGVDRATAIKLDEGFKRVETDDFGRSRVVDVVAEDVQEINIKPASGNEPIPPPEQSLFGLAEDATGPEASIKSGFSQLLSVAGGPVNNPEVIQARTSFSIATNDFIRALTLNKRFPVKEIERIREEINLKPKFFDSPELMQNRMVAIDRSLRERQRKALNNANNTRLPETARENAAGSAQDIEDFLSVLDVPPSPRTQKEYDAIPAKVLFIDTDGKLVRKGE